MDDDFDDTSTLLFKNIDAKVDLYSIDLEKQIQKLPSTLKFIKKYLYYEFLPKIDIAINELEAIKETPNYDEKMTVIRPISLRNTDQMTCIDMLSNHNIKHPKIHKIVYGTLKGNLCVFDLDSDKIVTEKNISKTNRVDCLSTATTKYYDTYLTRIAINCRSEINIHVLSYNHSFSIMNVECIINTVNPGQADPIMNAKIGLGYLINTLMFSKDIFYLYATDYQGGVRIYKFNDIPLMNPTITIESVSSSGNEGKEKKEKADSKQAQNKESTNSTNQIYMFITHVKNKENEDFTILPDTSKEENILSKGGKKPDPKQQQQQQGKQKGKDPKGNQKPDVNEPVVIDETVYNIQSEFDEEIGDVSLLQKFDKNHPMCHFVQTKLIFEEKVTAGYSASTITIGLYVAFTNSSNFKFVSLYPYLTDNMKTIFKVSKIKPGGALSIEESMSMNSQMLKKEKEYLNFVRSRLDNTLNPVASLAVSSNPKEKEKEKEQPKGKEAKKDDKDKDKDKDKDQMQIGSSVLTTKQLLEITKNEINFTTLFFITALIGQKSLSSINNILAIGMIDGSILIWDCELHCDKFLLQKNSRFEITSMIINDNYLTCGTKVGQIYIYELITGKEIYSCYHNPYTADPIYFLHSFFPLMVMGIDIQNKICLYNTKEKHKIAKLQLQEFDNQSNNYRISYFNRLLISQNEDYLVFICEKTDKTPVKTNLIDLIEFHKERNKLLLHKPHDLTTNFFNYSQEGLEFEENKLKIQQKMIHFFKIKDILFKCYPDLVYTSKKGLSIKKIMKKYDSNSYPTFDKYNDMNKTEDLLGRKSKSSKKSPEGIKEENDSALTVKMELLANNLSQPTDTLKSNQKEQPQEEHKAKVKIVSSKKKDIFYNSFKSIRNRYQYKDQRVNNIQLRNEKISKELAANKKK